MITPPDDLFESAAGRTTPEMARESVEHPPTAEGRIRRFCEELREQAERAALIEWTDLDGGSEEGPRHQPSAFIEGVIVPSPRGALSQAPMRSEAGSSRLPAWRLLSMPRRLNKTRVATVASVLLAIGVSMTTFGWISANARLFRTVEVLRRRTERVDIDESRLREIAVLLEWFRKSSRGGSVTLTDEQLDTLMRMAGAEQDRLGLSTAHGPVYSGDKSRFVRDVTCPDGSEVLAGKPFAKVWELENTGTVPWKSRFLQREGSEAAPGKLKSPKRVPIPDTRPGQQCVIKVDLVAPDQPGLCYAEWRMIDEDGNYLLPTYQPLYVLVNVVKE
jgi:hypothetical protein